MSILTRSSGSPKRVHRVSRALALKWVRWQDSEPQYPEGVWEYVPGEGMVWGCKKGEQAAFYKKFFAWQERQEEKVFLREPPRPEVLKWLK